MNNSKIRLKFIGSYLKQEDKAPFTPKNAVNLFIVYKLDRWSRDLKSEFTPKHCLFEAAKLIKNADPDKYKYSGYGIGFDLHLEFSLSDGSMGKNVIVFRADMSSSMHIDNKGKNILTLSEGPRQGLDDTALTAEAKYSIIFSRSQRKLCLGLHYNRSNSFLFVNATKKYQFKANNSEIKKYPMCLGNISKDFTSINVKKKQD